MLCRNLYDEMHFSGPEGISSYIVRLFGHRPLKVKCITVACVVT